MVFIAAVFLASGLIATASAGSAHAHHRHLHKRGAPSYDSSSAPPPALYSSSTVEEACTPTTWTTTWYGTPGLVPGTYTPPPPPPTTTSTSCTTTSTPPPPPPPSTTSTPPPPPPETSSYAPPPESSESSSSGPGGIVKGLIGGAEDVISGIVSNGNKWAMTYTPYANSGDCKSASDVMNDIGQIAAKGFTTVRLYATDCSGIENVGSAVKAHGMKMIMGIYIDGSGLGNAYSQLSELTSWGQNNGWDKVEMVVAGNEAVFNGFTSASALAGFIGDVKSQFKAAGYSGPVTTTEPLGTIQENASTFCGAVDVIAANIHPFFNGGISAEGAGDFVSSQLQLLSQACNGEKEAYNLETGWPSQGNGNGAAIPGYSEQKTAIDSIIAAAGGKSAIFSFENDSWKAPGNLGVEQYWGCASLFSG